MQIRSKLFQRERYRKCKFSPYEEVHRGKEKYAPVVGKNWISEAWASDWVDSKFEIDVSVVPG